MIGLDTNILVRLFVKDSPAEYDRAVALLKENRVRVSVSVIVETEVVLRHSYKLAPAKVREAFRVLLEMVNVVVEAAEELRMALDWAEVGLGFADAYHLALSQDIPTFATFDQRFAKRAEGLGSCAVKLLEA